MKIEEIQHLIDDVTIAADLFGQLSSRAQDDRTNHYIRQTEILKWRDRLIRRREKLIKAIKQYKEQK